VKIDQALMVARKARIRRHVPHGAAARDDAVATPSARPVLRDARGCFVKGGRGRPPRDALGEAYTADLFLAWRRHGKHALRQLCEEDPR